jgi:iron-sulfur cluster repair protein YtfE (RIC family)
MHSKGRKCECLNININQCSGEWREINMTLLKHLCKEHDIDFKDECRKLKQEKIEEAQQDIELLQDEMRDRMKELKTKINKLKKLSLDKVWST